MVVLAVVVTAVADVTVVDAMAPLLGGPIPPPPLPPLLPLPPLPLVGPRNVAPTAATVEDWPAAPTASASVSFSGDDDGSLDPCSCAFALTGLYGGIVLTLPPFFCK